MLFALIALFAPYSAQAFDLPEFVSSKASLANPDEPLIDFARERVIRFRVQVFPHLGAFVSPQGQDPSAKNVSIESESACIEFEAILNSDREWVKGAALTRKSVNLNFHSGKVKNSYFECAEPFVVKRAGSLKSYEYVGDFVVMTTAAQVKIINLVDPEMYLKGVIPSEVSASWPSEVLKAQAVAARSYAWWSVIKSRARESAYDLEDTVADQAYTGTSNRGLKSDEAADATEGQLMLSGNQVIKAYFSADSGGYTEDASSAFDEALNYCSAKAETYDLKLYPASHWLKIVTGQDLKTALVRAKLIPASVVINTVSVTAANRTASGRVKYLSVLGTDGKTYLIEGTSFRMAMRLRSSLFQVSANKGGFLFDGRGFGHGVGMAQIGALQYAQQFNWTFDQILNFYYSGINLQR